MYVKFVWKIVKENNNTNQSDQKKKPTVVVKCTFTQALNSSTNLRYST